LNSFKQINKSYNSFIFLCVEALDRYASPKLGSVVVEWANSVSKFSKWSLKVWVKSSVLKFPVFALKLGFYSIRIGRQLSLSAYTSSPVKSVSAHPVKIALSQWQEKHKWRIALNHTALREKHRSSSSIVRDFRRFEQSVRHDEPLGLV